MHPLIVAIDGPAGAGKSTVSKRLAQRFGLALVDTGAIYRCVALRARRDGVLPHDDAGLRSLLGSLTVSFVMEGDVNRVMLDGEDVSELIRAPEISRAASAFSRRPVVRAGLLELQRRLARASPTGAILEGRDIGTVVFPDAEVKVFLSADPVVRAQRRHAELASKGVASTLEEVLSEQNRRDQEDTERDVAPLKPAAEAERLDCSALGVDEVVERIGRLVASKRAPP